jgi:hypothetical protein
LENPAEWEPYLRAPPPYGLKKLKFFTKVIDEHVITDLSEIYSKGWAS